MALVDQLPPDGRRVTRRHGLNYMSLLLSTNPLPPTAVAELILLAATAIRSSGNVREQLSGFMGLAQCLKDHPSRDELAKTVKDIA